MANGFFFGNTLSDIQQARTAQAAMDEQRQARQAQQLFATLSQAAKMAADRREAEADRAARLFLGNRGFDIEREKIGVERERTKEILGAMQADRDRLLRDEQLKRAQIEADNQARLEIAKLQFGENNPQLRRQQEEIDYLIDEANSAAEGAAAFANSQLAALAQKIKKERQDKPWWRKESTVEAKGKADWLAGIAAIGTSLGEMSSSVHYNPATARFEAIKRPYRFQQNTGAGSSTPETSRGSGLLGPIKEPPGGFFSPQPPASPGAFTPVGPPAPSVSVSPSALPLTRPGTPLPAGWNRYLAPAPPAPPLVVPPSHLPLLRPEMRVPASWNQFLAPAPPSQEQIFQSVLDQLIRQAGY